MKRYLVLLAYEPGGWEAATPEERQVYVDGHNAFHAFVDEHGRRVSGAALADADTATTIRRRDGRALVTDGPFVESVEMIGGYYDIELPDLDVAIAAASMLPPAYTVEIRAVIELDDAGEQVG
ncbi:MULTISPECIES: YciI family protein [unclassified Knoellia]|uniref:YciI family protein n=1 Tax=Knoellia altitudinis TaxID=3404795 RepID=UPI00360E7CB6